jgi:hypothetical protein
MRTGDDAEVILVRSWNGRPVKLMGEIRWCRPDGAGAFLAGVRLRRRLSRKDLLDLVR